MQLENIIVDATAPGRLGRFWEQALSTRTLIDSEEEGFETRLDLPGGGFLDLCFQPVPHRPTEPQRLHLDLLGGARQLEVAQRLRSWARATWTSARARCRGSCSATSRATLSA